MDTTHCVHGVPTSDPCEACAISARPRLIYPASSASPVTAALTPEQRRKAWSAWRLGPQCQQIILDVAAGEREFADAIEAVFMAGIEAAVKS